MNILIIGPSIARSEGPMAEVITNQLHNPQVNVHHHLHYVSAHANDSVLEKLLYSVKSFFYLLINHNRFQIIHFHTAADASFYRNSILLRLSKWFNKKTITHIQAYDFDSFYLNSKPLLKKYIRNSLGKNDRILVRSEYWKNFFTREFHSSPVDILSSPVNAGSFADCIKETTNYDKYLFMGCMVEEQGIYDFIRAVDMVVNSYGRSELQFIITGEGEMEKVKKIVEIRRLKKNVTVLGPLNNNEKKKLLKEVDVAVLPSYCENFPQSISEAMACGKIIISTYAGGIPDLVQHGVNGYLFDAGDTTQLVKYILHVHDNPEIMDSISRNNIRSSKENFSPEIVSERLHRIYDSI